ncbi:sulfite exporter TauE/SafE family protein [Rhodobacter sp. 24-YEA-8]|uniref:sulfite exporter TauE/SafE family protein n=1 Tax=Rhodobacter sp. 24-YEA-8 TaxID=1884310 RepID=UPI0008996ABF|nr:sulfite exporter TauE/SafE family protein [Rhodobacter sp. 24-YEA-8]SEB56149.1 hypothetical protein SAMN05519105_0761 [Rhodobacter sp. 24-YEA-8]
MSDLTIFLVAATFLLAGIVKGVTGMGLPTVAMGVLGALLSPPAAASLLIVPSMVTNLWQLLAGPGLSGLVRRLWPMMVASMAGTLISAPLMSSGNLSLTTKALGATLIAYALYTLFAPPFRVPSRHETWLSPLIGLATGLVAGATGVFVIPAVPYLQALGLKKDDLVQALGMSFTTSTIALALGLASQAVWQGDQFVLSVMAVAPALAGMRAGHYLRRAISPQTFRRWFLIMLALLGAEMLLRGIV